MSFLSVWSGSFTNKSNRSLKDKSKKNLVDKLQLFSVWSETQFWVLALHEIFNLTQKNNFDKNCFYNKM